MGFFCAGDKAQSDCRQVDFVTTQIHSHLKAETFNPRHKTSRGTKKAAAKQLILKGVEVVQCSCRVPRRGNGQICGNETAKGHESPALRLFKGSGVWGWCGKPIAQISTHGFRVPEVGASLQSVRGTQEADCALWLKGLCLRASEGKVLLMLNLSA